MANYHTSRFEVETAADGEGSRITVTEVGGDTRHYQLTGGEQHDYIAF
jgi:hypothetical protein